MAKAWSWPRPGPWSWPDFYYTKLVQKLTIQILWILGPWSSGWPLASFWPTSGPWSFGRPKAGFWPTSGLEKLASGLPPDHGPIVDQRLASGLPLAQVHCTKKLRANFLSLFIKRKKETKHFRNLKVRLNRIQIFVATRYLIEKIFQDMPNNFQLHIIKPLLQ